MEVTVPVPRAGLAGVTGEAADVSAGMGPGGWRRVGGEASLFWEPTGARGVNRECGSRQSSKAEAQLGH